MIPRDALIEDVEWLLSPMGGREHPEVIARRLGMTMSGIEKAMRTAGRIDLAVPFSRARSQHKPPAPRSPIPASPGAGQGSQAVAS